MTHTAKVAAAHIAPVFMDKTASAEKAAHWVTKAGAEGGAAAGLPRSFPAGVSILD